MSLQTEKHRQSYIDYINKNYSLNRSLFISCHVDDYLGYNRGNLSREELFHRISKLITRFNRSLEKYCFSKDQKRLEKLSVIEMFNRKHFHIVVETPQHISKERMKQFIEMSFVDSKRLYDLDIRDVDYRYSLYEYMTKEQVNLNEDTVDIKNSYFKKLN